MSHVRNAPGRGPKIPATHYRICIQGQSNALGLAPVSELASVAPDVDDLVGSAFARVLIWNPDDDEYQPLLIGTNQLAYNSATFGPELGLAYRWTTETTGGLLFLDKQATGGQAISYFVGGTDDFTEAEARRTAADAWLSERGLDVVSAAWLWVQGEANSLALQAEYYNALVDLVSDRIAAGLQQSTEKRLLVQMNASSAYYSANVAAAKVQYKDANSSTTIIIDGPSYLDVDNIHWNARGQLQLGYDAYQHAFNTTSKAA